MRNIQMLRFWKLGFLFLILALYTPSLSIASANTESTKEQDSGEYVVINWFGTSVSEHAVSELLHFVFKNTSMGNDRFLFNIDLEGGNSRLMITLYNIMRDLPITIYTNNVQSTDLSSIVFYCLGDKRFADEKATFKIPRSNNLQDFEYTKSYQILEQCVPTNFKDFRKNHIVRELRVYKDDAVKFGLVTHASPVTYRPKELLTIITNDKKETIVKSTLD